MCRSSNFEYHLHHHHEAAAAPDPSTTTTITGFYVRLCAHQSSSSPDSLTLLLSPAPATISLLRIQLPTDKHLILFASSKQQRLVRVATTQPLSFHLYVGESMLLKGAILIKNKKKSQNHSLKLELCKTNSISEVEFWVAFDGHVAVGDKVTLEKPIPLWRRSNKRNTTKLLEDIPEEETEYEEITDEEEEEEEEGAIEELEMDLEVLRKALDMGIWALCLGLGFVVSKASLTNFS